jgi:hypothetical protein
VLAAALGLISLTLAQCTLVDNVTGVGIDRNGTTTCIKGCNDAAIVAHEACKRAHETQQEYCKTLAEPDRTACLNQASADRTTCMDSANTTKQQCQLDCAHHQGAGSAG